jgi:hypothetical protein
MIRRIGQGLRSRVPENAFLCGDLLGYLPITIRFYQNSMFEVVLSVLIVVVLYEQLRDRIFTSSSIVDRYSSIISSSGVLNEHASSCLGVEKVLEGTLGMATNSKARLEAANMLVEPCGWNCNVRASFLPGSEDIRLGY